MSIDKKLKNTVESLKRAQARREKRLQNMRTVYAYRTPEGLCDNLILLPTSCEMAHKEFLRNNFASILSQMKEDLRPYVDCEIVRIGRFDKIKCELTKGTVEVVVPLSEVIKKIKEVEK